MVRWFGDDDDVGIDLREKERVLFVLSFLIELMPIELTSFAFLVIFRGFEVVPFAKNVNREV